MFLSRVQIGFYRIESIHVSFFRVQVYLSRFLLIPVLSDKITRPKNTCKFFVRFQIGYFRVDSSLDFRVKVKILRPNINSLNLL